MRWCVVVATGGGVGIVGGQGEGVLTVILQGTYRIPSALRSQALSGPLSTEVGDSSGNVGAVSFFLSPHAGPRLCGTTLAAVTAHPREPTSGAALSLSALRRP